MTIESALINCHYPVTPTSFLLPWGAIVRAAGCPTPRRPGWRKFAEFVGPASSRTWRSGGTRAGGQPAALRRGRPGLPGGRWYEQFYRDVADLEPDMVARFEFEIDTTRPVDGWEPEVAANLARQGHAG